MCFLHFVRRSKYGNICIRGAYCRPRVKRIRERTSSKRTGLEARICIAKTKPRNRRVRDSDRSTRHVWSRYDETRREYARTATIKRITRMHVDRPTSPARVRSEIGFTLAVAFRSFFPTGSTVRLSVLAPGCVEYTLSFQRWIRSPDNDRRIFVHFSRRVQFVRLSTYSSSFTRQRPCFVFEARRKRLILLTRLSPTPGRPPA